MSYVQYRNREAKIHQSHLRQISNRDFLMVNNIKVRCPKCGRPLKKDKSCITCE